LQNKSDWSKHQKPANITVTSKITFLGYPRSKFVFLFFSHKNARGKYETREKLSETRSSDRSSVVLAKQQRQQKKNKKKKQNQETELHPMPKRPMSAYNFFSEKRELES